MKSLSPDQDGPNGLSISVEVLLKTAGLSHIGIMRTDAFGYLLSANQFLIDTIGGFTQWAPPLWRLIFHPDDYPTIVRNARTAIGSVAGVFMRDVSRIRHQDGDAYHWFATCSVLEEAEPGQAAHWVTFFTELPSSQFLDDRMRSAVNDGETRYRALFNGSSDAMLLVHNHRIVDCNEAAARLCGGTRERLLGADARDMAANSERRRAESLQVLGRQLDKQPLVRAAACIKKLDGSGNVDVDTSIVRIKLGADTFELATFRDVSRELDAELQLRETNRALAQQNANMAWLQEASERIYAQPDLQSLADEVVRSVHAHYSAPQVHFALREGEGYRLLATSLNAENSRKGLLLARNRILDKALNTPDKTWVSKNFVRDLGAQTQLARDLIERAVQTFALIVLLDNSEELGVLALEYDANSQFNPDDLDTLKVLVRTLTLAVAKTKSLTALAYQANHDTLTGLHNRSVLHREFEQWQSGANGPVALMLLDLNRFKEINDTLGHHVGDDLLCQIGGRLQAAIEPHQALLCRLGGDEFAVLICGQLRGAEASTALANHLAMAIRKPFVVNEVQLEISASIGVSLYPQHGVDSHSLLRFADVAMYEAKRSGVGVMLYDARLDLNSPQRLHLIADLNKGIRHRELELHYQPKLDLRSGVIVGCEALVRWQHPRLGLLSPDEFVPLAEVGDTIHALTAFVIEEAVEQQQRWAAAGINLHVAVNLSARNLIDDRVVRQIEHLAQCQRLTAGSLEIEITETALMHDPARAGILLQRMAAVGVRLAIDDFGTGYSSLGYLRSMPIDTLKIDRGFVRDMLAKPQDAVIVQSIISLAHNLKQHVVAEGVEDLQVMAALIDMGCDLAQGFVLSQPLPADTVPSWLSAYTADPVARFVKLRMDAGTVVRNV